MEGRRDAFLPCPPEGGYITVHMLEVGKCGVDGGSKVRRAQQKAETECLLRQGRKRYFCASKVFWKQRHLQRT